MTTPEPEIYTGVFNAGGIGAGIYSLTSVSGKHIQHPQQHPPHTKLHTSISLTQKPSPLGIVAIAGHSLSAGGGDAVVGGVRVSVASGGEVVAGGSTIRLVEMTEVPTTTTAAAAAATTTSTRVRTTSNGGSSTATGTAASPTSSGAAPAAAGLGKNVVGFAVLGGLGAFLL